VALLREASSAEIAELAQHIDRAGRLAGYVPPGPDRDSDASITVACLSMAADHYWDSLRAPDTKV